MYEWEEERWIYESDKAKKDLWERRRNARKEGDALSWEWAHTIGTNPTAAASIKEKLDAVNAVRGEISKEEREHEKRYGDRLPQFSELTMTAFSFLGAFSLWLPGAILDVERIGDTVQSVLALPGLFILTYLFFRGVDATLKWVRNSESGRKWKAVLVTAGWCVVVTVLHGLLG